MKAQIVLTPNESKKLIAKSVVRMDSVQKALSNGMVVMHPSSSTYFIFEEIVGTKPMADVWVCGWVGPHGTCVELGRSMHSLETAKADLNEASGHDPEDFDSSWVIQNGEVRYGATLKELFEEMGPGDIYIKGVNALDAGGNVGVLIGSTTGAGTIGRVVTASRKKGFSLIFPTGLEKLIPGTIREAASMATRGCFEYAMGIPAWLFPVEGLTVTEIDAVNMLTGARAVPVSSGGLGGAEGAVTLAIEGESESVQRAIDYAEASKGARLPQVRKANCHTCNVSFCTFPPKDKPWEC